MLESDAPPAGPGTPRFRLPARNPRPPWRVNLGRFATAIAVLSWCGSLGLYAWALSAIGRPGRPFDFAWLMLRVFAMPVALGATLAALLALHAPGESSPTPEALVRRRRLGVALLTPFFGSFALFLLLLVPGFAPAPEMNPVVLLGRAVDVLLFCCIPGAFGVALLLGDRPCSASALQVAGMAILASLVLPIAGSLAYAFLSDPESRRLLLEQMRASIGTAVLILGPLFFVACGCFLAAHEIRGTSS
jgi:hypothetical protein